MDKKPFFKRFGYLFSLGSLVGAFLFLLGTVLKVEIKYYVDGEKIKEYFSFNFISLLNPELTKTTTMIIIISLIGLSAVLILLSGLLSKRVKVEIIDGFVAGSIFASLIAICFIFASKEIFDYFASNGNPYIENYNDVSLGWASHTSILFLTISIIFDISYSSYSEQTSIKAMAEDGLLIAAAFVLNFLKLPITATGGSINFQMLPLMIIALRRGPVHGFICGGLVYGALTCLTDGYGLATYPFDYLIGFGSVAIMGFFRKLIISEEQTNYNFKGELFILVGGILSTFVRFIGSTISSMVIYNYQFIPAVIYNVVYISVSGAVSVAVIMLAYGPLLILNKQFPTNR